MKPREAIQELRHIVDNELWKKKFPSVRQENGKWVINKSLYSPELAGLIEHAIIELDNRGNVNHVDVGYHTLNDGYVLIVGNMEMDRGCLALFVPSFSAEKTYFRLLVYVLGTNPRFNENASRHIHRSYNHKQCRIDHYLFQRR